MDSINDLRIFTSAHVYAVWDFMSLLKFLQIKLTTITIPWMPSDNTTTAKLINEIVAGEETDENESGKPMSHFEMYLESIESIDVKTDQILTNINSLNNLETIEEDIEKLEIKDYVKDFLKFTFSVIKRGKIHEVAAVFTFGREDLIPDMFMPLLEGINSENNELNKLIYYFKRHIEVDGDIKVGGKSLKDFMEVVSERLNILTPNPELLEKYDALKEAYEHYKILEKLCTDDGTVHEKT